MTSSEWGIRDWSSAVCSSDLTNRPQSQAQRPRFPARRQIRHRDAIINLGQHAGKLLRRRIVIGFRIAVGDVAGDAGRTGLGGSLGSRQAAERPTGILVRKVRTVVISTLYIGSASLRERVCKSV